MSFCLEDIPVSIPSKKSKHFRFISKLNLKPNVPFNLSNILQNSWRQHHQLHPTNLPFPRIFSSERKAFKRNYSHTRNLLRKNKNTRRKETTKDGDEFTHKRRKKSGESLNVFLSKAHGKEEKSCGNILQPEALREPPNDKEIRKKRNAKWGKWKINWAADTLSLLGDLASAADISPLTRKRLLRDFRKFPTSRRVW